MSGAVAGGNWEPPVERQPEVSEEGGFPGGVLKDGGKSAVRSFVYLYVHTCVSLNATVHVWRLHNSLWDVALPYHPCVSWDATQLSGLAAGTFILPNEPSHQPWVRF